MRNTDPGARPIRVLHLITGLEVGGAEMSLLKLLHSMDRDRFASEVVGLTNEGPMAARFREIGVPVTVLGMRRGVPAPLALLRLASLLRARRPDILQTWLYHADLAGLLAGRLARTPAIAWNLRCSTMDARYERGFGGLLLKLLARLSRWPNAVVSNSQAAITMHADLGYRPKEWLLLPNGFDLVRFQPDPEARETLRAELRLGAEASLVGLIARYDPIKDHATYFRAAAELLRTYPAARFVLVGKGIDATNSTLADVIRAHGVEPNVHLLGERSDIPRITAALDVATCSSTGEGFPNVIGEAMACGVPVVATDVGDARMIVGDCGEIVPPRDWRAMAGGWRRILQLEGAERRALSVRARQRIARDFDTRSAAAKYEAFYDGLLADR